MARARPHSEVHAASRIGWLRAAVLGANDGIVSTASLILGMAAGTSDRGAALLAGVAGLVAGALSMAAGEYVSVSSQADGEAADLAREATELATLPEQELAELTDIYRRRGLSAELASEVARRLTDADALAAHARDELGITELSAARPIQAAMASALTFSAGAAMPLVATWLTPTRLLVPAVAAVSMIALAMLGALGAWAGGANAWKPTTRVLLWGAAAMAATSLIGRAFGAAA